jgi:ATP-dependent DNA helicase RecG
VYPTTQGLPQAYLRKAVASGLRQAALEDILPPRCWQALGLDAQWTLRRALTYLHQPPPEAPTDALQSRQHPAWQRLKAEEMLAQLIAQRRARAARQSQQALALPATPGNGLPQALLQRLPFALTPAQARVLEEIAADLARDVPMHRLLQGDVGCGKTVVAALAACIAIEAGAQCALMAPTEILARQHFVKLAQWLEPLLHSRGQTVAWLTGSQNKTERRRMQAHIQSGQAALVVGTQALIQDDVQFARLGLVVVDEQHRFGVAQRLTLRQKNEHGQQPHLLMMTATPIPRTLAMTLLSDLDISTIDALPPGRTPILTKVIDARRRGELMSRLREQLQAGRQAYWVCPLIEESEALDLRHATQVFDELTLALAPATDAPATEGTEPSGVVGLLHGRQSAAEKKAVMDAFVAAKLQVLVSTTVIEVGVDVPNASLMVIEHAERFGLSQLHQLRGRVGRGSAASVCVLLFEPPLGEVARARLQAMAQTQDGFVLAQTDLRLRGPGELLGSRQSGTGPNGRANKPTGCWLSTRGWRCSMCSVGWAPAQVTLMRNPPWAHGTIRA